MTWSSLYMSTELLVCGVAYHHAGLDATDRKALEGMFTKGEIPVLCMCINNQIAYQIDHKICTHKHTNPFNANTMFSYTFIYTHLYIHICIYIYITDLCLVCTSTLAMGVNLPAHLVVVKGTMQYANSGFTEYSESQILQMIGRAGRPQFDTSATAVIMTKNKSKVSGPVQVRYI